MLKSMHGVIAASGGAVAPDSGWDLSTAQYNGVFKIIGAGVVMDVALSTDGTKMYHMTSSLANSYVGMWELSTAWDVSTAAFTAGDFVITGGEDESPQDVVFKPDGTKMYVLGGETDRVYEYALTTPWDLGGTVTYTGVSLDISLHGTANTGLFINPDGTSLYHVESINDLIYQYDMSPAWDLLSASDTGNTFDIAGETTIAFGLSFQSNGSSVYVVDRVINTVFQYTVDTPWDLSTTTDVGVVSFLADQDSQQTGMFFRENGLRLYLSGNTNDAIIQYDLDVS